MFYRFFTPRKILPPSDVANAAKDFPISLTLKPSLYSISKFSLGFFSISMNCENSKSTPVIMNKYYRFKILSIPYAFLSSITSDSSFEVFNSLNSGSEITGTPSTDSL